jgi:hypothetical protein
VLVLVASSVVVGGVGEEEEEEELSLAQKHHAPSVWESTPKPG